MLAVVPSALLALAVTLAALSTLGVSMVASALVLVPLVLVVVLIIRTQVMTTAACVPLVLVAATMGPVVRGVRGELNGVPLVPLLRCLEHRMGLSLAARDFALGERFVGCLAHVSRQDDIGPQATNKKRHHARLVFIAAGIVCNSALQFSIVVYIDDGKVGGMAKVSEYDAI